MFNMEIKKLQEQLSDLMERFTKQEKELKRKREKTNSSRVLSEEEVNARVSNLNSTYEKLKDNYLTITVRNHPIVILSHEGEYYLFLTHILTLIEITTKNKIPNRFSLFTESHLSNSNWYKDKHQMTRNQFGIQEVIDSNLSKVNILFDSCYQRNSQKRKIFLIKLCYDDPEVVVQFPRVHMYNKERVHLCVGEECYLDRLIKLVYSKVIYPSSDNISDITPDTKKEIKYSWKKKVNSSELLTLGLEKQLDQLELFNRVDEAEKVIDSFDDMYKRSILNYPERFSYYLFSHKGLNCMNEECDECTFVNKQLNILEFHLLDSLGKRKDQPTSYTLYEKLNPYPSTNVKTLENKVNQLREFYGFVNGLLFLNDIRLEQDIVTFFLASNFNKILDIWISFSVTKEKNIDSTISHKIQAIKWGLQGFIKYFIDRQEDTSYKTSLLLSLHQRIDECTAKGKSFCVGQTKIQNTRKNMTAVVEGISLSIDEHVCVWKYLVSNTTFDKLKVVKQNCNDDLRRSIIKNIQAKLFFALISTKFGGRNGHYTSLGVRNTKSIKMYCDQDTRGSNNIEDPIVWTKKYCLDYINKPEHKSHFLFAGINMLDREIYQRKVDKQNFLVLLVNQSMAFIDYAVEMLYILNESDRQVEGYLTWREFKTSEEKYKYLEERGIDFLDKLDRKSPDIRFFFVKENDLILGNHLNETKREATYGRYLLEKVFRETLSDYFKVNNIKGKNPKQYTITGIRHMIQELCEEGGLNESEKKLMSRSIFGNEYQTQETVYNNTDRWARNKRLREWQDTPGSAEIEPKKKKLRVGMKLKKIFDGKWYTGTVTGTDHEKKTHKLLYHIHYEDSDTEDLYLEQIENGVEEGIMELIHG